LRGKRINSCHLACCHCKAGSGGTGSGGTACGNALVVRRRAERLSKAASATSPRFPLPLSWRTRPSNALQGTCDQVTRSDTGRGNTKRLSDTERGNWKRLSGGRPFSPPWQPFCGRSCPSPTLLPTHPVPRGLLTLCPWASSCPQGLYTAYIQPICSLYTAYIHESLPLSAFSQLARAVCDAHGLCAMCYAPPIRHAQS